MENGTVLENKKTNKNMPIFENFRLLKENMDIEGWIIEAFAFKYKTRNYVVLVKLYLENENRPKYSLLKIQFLKENNFEESLEISANVNGFDVDTKVLREFFEIEYSKNIGDVLKQFNIYFSSFIPTQINISKPENLKHVIWISLFKSDNEDPNKKYCFSLKRNPKGEFRTIYNDNKAKILRPKLYENFANEKSISFCFSKEINSEKSDEEIIINFSK